MGSLDFLPNHHIYKSIKKTSILQNNNNQNQIYKYTLRARKNAERFSIILGVLFSFFLLAYLGQDHRKKAENIKLVSLSTRRNYETVEEKRSLSFLSKIKVDELVHNNDISEYPFFLDIKLRNIGNETSFGKKIELKFYEIEIDPTPVFDYFVSLTEEGNHLCMIIKNYGWGEAKNVELIPFKNNLLKSLKIKSDSDIQWKGQINYALVLTLPKEIIRNEFKLTQEEYIEVKSILDRGWSRETFRVGMGPNLDEKDNKIRARLKETGKAFLFEDFIGGMNYIDKLEKSYESEIYWCWHNPLFYDILLTLNGFEIRTLTGAAARKEPSYTYDIILNPDKIKQFDVIKIDISQEIKPNETDRFLLKIKSEKSAFYKFDLKIVFDEDNKIVKYESIILNTLNLHENKLEKYDLFVYDYEKKSWVKNN